MKVICINDNFSPGYSFDPKIGDELTVVDCKMFKQPSYIFSEINSIIEANGKKIQYWFNSTKFAPLDTYKEKEISELKEELQLL